MKKIVWIVVGLVVLITMGIVIRITNIEQGMLNDEGRVLTTEGSGYTGKVPVREFRN